MYKGRSHTKTRIDAEITDGRMEGEGMKGINETEEEVFHLVQQFLRPHPVIIWGSGATIPYGLPSMNDLSKKLKPKLGGIDGNADLETELGKVDDSKIDEIKKIIRDEVVKGDRTCLKKSLEDTNYFEAIIKMMEKFYNSHPKKIDIVTTNYDCVLEYALSKSNYNFTDGFTGRSLSKFNPEAFGERKIINLIKVHGSLNWFSDENNDIFYLPCEHDSNKLKYRMVVPARNKYHEASQEPYRTLIKKSDNAIEKASSFLVVGFGFNDEHLTPKIDDKIKASTPIVIITKKATDSCIGKLKNAGKYCLFEESDSQTKVRFKKGKDSDQKTVGLKEDYWKLDKFMEIL